MLNNSNNATTSYSRQFSGIKIPQSKIKIRIPQYSRTDTINEWNVINKKIKKAVYHEEFDFHIQYSCKILEKILKDKECDDNTINIATHNLKNFVTNYKNIFKNLFKIAPLIQEDIITLNLKKNYAIGNMMKLSRIALACLPSPIATAIDLYFMDNLQKETTRHNIWNKTSSSQDIDYLKIFDKHILHLVIHLATERLEQLKDPNFIHKNKALSYVVKTANGLTVIEDNINKIVNNEDFDSTLDILKNNMNLASSDYMSCILTVSALEGAEIFGTRNKEEAVELVKKYHGLVGKHLIASDKNMKKISLLKALESQVKPFEKGLQELQHKNKILKKNVRNIQQKMAHLEHDNIKLKEDMKIFTQETSEQMMQVQQKNTELEERLNELHDMITKQPAKKKPFKTFQRLFSSPSRRN